MRRTWTQYKLITGMVRLTHSRDKLWTELIIFTATLTTSSMKTRKISKRESMIRTRKQENKVLHKNYACKQHLRMNSLKQ